jgi:hypothetical protein
MRNSIYHKYFLLKVQIKVLSLIRRIKKKIRALWYYNKDKFIKSYSYPDYKNQSLFSFLPKGIKFSITEPDKQAGIMHQMHYFNLLGSGWNKVYYGMPCEGFLSCDKSYFFSSEKQNIALKTSLQRFNKSNRKVIMEIATMISKDYKPIDWQLDFKSGYRWSESDWYKDIKSMTFYEGVDIKVPWELSRMHHLPELAMIYSLNKEENLLIEFKDQVLDWIATNPPRFGVNWACTMDVGIRIANLLIAYDIFVAQDASFDKLFLDVFTSSIYDHASHIIKNLEWSETTRANHYLGNIAGLLFASAFLPSNKQTDAWLAFSVQELFIEVERQFLRDGGHFEASTNYHRLCAEIAAVSATFIESLPRDRIASMFNSSPRYIKYSPGLNSYILNNLAIDYKNTGKVLPFSFYQKLKLAAQFTHDITKFDGTVPQIGDNDSGRFVRLGGWVSEKCGDSLPKQLHLNHQQWLAWASVIFDKKDLLLQDQNEIWQSSYTLAASLFRFPVKNLHDYNSVHNYDNPLHKNSIKSFNNIKFTHLLKSDYESNLVNLFQNAKYLFYPDFGVYIVRSASIFLLIRCGSAINDGIGVHAHEDQLSFEFEIDGNMITADPGSYVYTPSKQIRNQYRSSFSHCSPSIFKPEEDYFERNIFSAPETQNGECLYFGVDGFIGKISNKEGVVYRKFVFNKSSLSIEDYYSLAGTCKPASKNLFKPAMPLVFSNGYGSLITNNEKKNISSCI